MKIKSNAAPNELSSPFFEANKQFCSEFESYIASKNGKVKGNYNAYSYLIYGKLSNPKSWDVMYKKSTFTTSGNLLLSSEYEGLLVMAEWSTELKGLYTSKFRIRKRKLFDFIRLLFNNSFSKLSLTNKYPLISKERSPKFLPRLIDILQPLFLSKEIYNIELSNEKLKIELRSKQHHFNILDQILNLPLL